MPTPAPMWQSHNANATQHRPSAYRRLRACARGASNRCRGAQMESVRCALRARPAASLQSLVPAPASHLHAIDAQRVHLLHLPTAWDPPRSKALFSFKHLRVPGAGRVAGNRAAVAVSGTHCEQADVVTSAQVVREARLFFEAVAHYVPGASMTAGKPASEQSTRRHAHTCQSS